MGVTTSLSDFELNDYMCRRAFSKFAMRLDYIRTLM